MAYYSYAWAAGHDQTVLENIETTLATMPRAGIKGTIVPLGSVRRTTLNQHVQSNGTRIIKWQFPALKNDDFDTLITEFFTDYETESADVTIDSRASDETFRRYNAVAVRPVEGQDYTRREFGDVEDLTLTFRVIAEI